MRRAVVRSSLLAVLVACAQTQAVVLRNFDTSAATGDPTTHSTAPTGALANSGWQYEGVFGSSAEGFWGATAIGPHAFITAGHLGGLVTPGAVISYNGTNYTVTSDAGLANRDMIIVTVSGNKLPSWAPIYNESLDGALYNSGTGVGKTLVVTGHGTQRGSEVDAASSTTGTALRGWNWGTVDGVQRWGTNVVTGYTNLTGVDTTPPSPDNGKEYLLYNFDSNGLTDEGIISSGDSGGGNFAQSSGGLWKLAGVNSMVVGYPYRFTATGTTQSGQASIVDYRDLYLQGTDGVWRTAQSYFGSGQPIPQQGAPENLSDVPLSELAPFIQPGDANLDGKVDTADFQIVASHFGKTGQSWITGDFNSDGVVNALDFNAVASNFGLTYSSTTGTASLATLVPEPTVTAPLLLVTIGLARRWRRK